MSIPLRRSIRCGEPTVTMTESQKALAVEEVKDSGKLNVPIVGLVALSDHETKSSEEDSGVGQERSGSGSEEELSPQKSDSETEEGVWEIERIIDYDRLTDMYKIKWKDWHDDFNTWETMENLVNCEIELLRFYNERKKERTDAEAQGTYLTLPNRKRRRHGQSFGDIPPDPRPLQFRAQEFYKVSQVPSQEEIDDCETVWKSFFNAKKNTLLWPISQLDRVLEDGMEGKLSISEQKTLREQLLVRQFDQRRQTVLKQLKEWERDINSITNGLPTVTIENDVDLAGPPPGFKYIVDYVAAPGISIPDEPPLGCSCTNCIQTKKDCCAHQSNSTFAYSQYKRLRVPIGTPIYECNKTCKCGPDCCNRVVQDGQISLHDKHFTIYRTSNGCGWGVKTQRAIKRGTFVSLYVGEVITTAESDRRSQEYDAEACTYLFDLDFNEDEGFPYAVDASTKGNIAHFFNHSCDPNLAVFAVWVNCLDPNLPKLALFAIKDIPRGAQLTFDYMNQISNTPGTPGFVDDIKHTRKPCLCLADDCRKFLFI